MQNVASGAGVDKATMLMTVRVLPFVAMAGLVFSRRLQAFHIFYLRRALWRPLVQHVQTHHKRATNPVLDAWLSGALRGDQGRVLHVVAGDSLVGKTTTTLHKVAKRRGLYMDLFAVNGPEDVRAVVVQQIVAQSNFLFRIITPLKMDLRVVLPVSVKMRPLLGRFTFGKYGSNKPIIIVKSAERLFQVDKDNNDSKWILWVLIEVSRYCDVVLICSDEAALQNLLPVHALSPFLSVIFCPEPPHSYLAAMYARHFPPEFPEHLRKRLGRRMAELFRRAPQLGNEALRCIARGQLPDVAAKLTIEQAAQAVAHQLGLKRPSAWLTAEKAEELLLGVECILLFALSPSGRLANRAHVQSHDPAPRRLMQLGLLRMETGRSGARHVRVAQDSAIVWALSEDAPRGIVRVLLAELRRDSTGDCERREQLAARVELMLERCLDARKVLDGWINQYIQIDGPDEAEDWRRILEYAPHPGTTA